MTRAERLAILGAPTVAEIHRRVAEAPPPTPALVEELRRIWAPALQQHREQRAADHAHPEAA